MGAHGQIWSLWDMLLLNSQKFLRLLANINHISGWSMSQEVESGLVISEAEVLESAENVELLKQLELPVSMAQAKKLCYQVEQAFAEKKPAKVKFTISELSSRIYDELSSRHLLALTHEEAELYDQKCPLFGVAVDLAFPSSDFDISEVGKCLALSRPTAAVMHCMRALETPLQIMAKKLNVLNTRENWGRLLTDIDKAIIDLPNRDTNKPVYTEAAIQFRHIKVAWRDHAMHARGKYTEDESRTVMNAAKELMCSLAKSINDQG